jgi:intracellular multiplication protein IcmJ
MENHRLPLQLSVKRGEFRSGDAKTAVADQQLRSVRPTVLSRDKMTCVACGYKVLIPAHLDVHHKDDDHTNNDGENLASLCHACHPVNHIGESSSNAGFAESLGDQAIIGFIPEISQADLSILQRTIGAALHDPDLKDVARQILKAITARSDLTKDSFGTWFASDFAGALAQLKDQEYAERQVPLEGQRLLFSPKVCKKLGEEYFADYKSLPPATWRSVVDKL